MATRAYDNDYLMGAQRVLGDAVDFAVMTLELDPDVFGTAFAVSDVSKQFARGNPRYVAGMNGCELARMALVSTNTSFVDADDVMYIDKSPEFWGGWALAYYQWYSGYSFIKIFDVAPLSRIIEMYPTYHEMDIMRFVERMQLLMNVAYPLTRLRAKRERCGFSQADLAIDSGVSLRQIQLFEQRQRDINKTAAETLLRLSRSLHCEMEDLMEKQTITTP